jgi:hypothetical protein
MDYPASLDRRPGWLRMLRGGVTVGLCLWVLGLGAGLASVRSTGRAGGQPAVPQAGPGIDQTPGESLVRRTLQGRQALAARQAFRTVDLLSEGWLTPRQARLPGAVEPVWGEIAPDGTTTCLPPAR